MERIDGMNTYQVTVVNLKQQELGSGTLEAETFELAVVEAYKDLPKVIKDILDQAKGKLVVSLKLE